MCNYDVGNAENGYFSDNEDSPRPKHSFIPPEEDGVVNVE